MEPLSISNIAKNIKKDVEDIISQSAKLIPQKFERLPIPTIPRRDEIETAWVMIRELEDQIAELWNEYLIGIGKHPTAEEYRATNITPDWIVKGVKTYDEHFITTSKNENRPIKIVQLEECQNCQEIQLERLISILDPELYYQSVGDKGYQIISLCHFCKEVIQ